MVLRSNCSHDGANAVIADVGDIDNELSREDC